MVVDQTHLSAHSHSILDPIIIRHHPTPSALESIDASHHWNILVTPTKKVVN